MWLRNLLFVAVCLAGAGWVAGNLLPGRETAARPRGRSTASSPVVDVPAAPSPGAEASPAAALDRLNAEFRNHWQQEGLTAAPRADDLTIARRLSLALVGSVPSLEEIRALEGLPDGERIPWWIDRLLADRRFSDYWAERLARVYVGNDQGPFILFRRRRFTLWLSEQLHQNQPYDQIVRSLLADEGIWTGQPATNFVTATANQGNDNQPDPIRLAGRTARAFLGMRIDCLQCHDDKLGTILVGSPENVHPGTQADFHQLAAFFAAAEIRLVGVRDQEKPYKYQYLNAADETVVPPKVPFGKEHFEGHGTRREQLARWVTHANNRPFARATVNRVWALLAGQPLVEPIDDLPLAGRFPPGLQALADDFVAHGYDLHRLIRLVALSDPFQRDSRAEFEITDRHEAAWAAFPLSRLRPEQMAGALIQASSLTTLDGEAHVLLQLAKFDQVRKFVERYGDLGEDEFTDRGSTIPQRLLMMNGNLVKERTSDNPLNSAATRIALLSGHPERQVEAAYLAVLTRRPSDAERDHFAARLREAPQRQRAQALEDLYWTLVNSTEFSWNH